MEQNGKTRRRDRVFKRLKLLKSKHRHNDHKLTGYIVTDTDIKCNRFFKKIQKNRDYSE